MLMRKLAALILAHGSLPLGGLHSGAIVTTGELPASPYVLNCAGRRIEPGDLGFGCGQQPGEILSGATAVQWDTWTSTSATTSEHTWTFSICYPTCTLNHKVHATATLRLSDVNSADYYTEATLTFKDLPAEMQDVGFTNPFEFYAYLSPATSG